MSVDIAVEEAVATEVSHAMNNRCDICQFRSYVIVMRYEDKKHRGTQYGEATTDELSFCKHHYDVNEFELILQGFRISYDRREELYATVEVL